ncbi:18727_t:CDS:2, partial [Racocetra fulgida]
LDQPSLQELKTALEKGSEEAKIDTMKKILVTMLNGDPLPQLLMHVIRFVMPSKNKTLKKLLHFYWEICPKTNPDGKLKQEMILPFVLDHLKNIEAHCTGHVVINILVNDRNFHACYNLFSNALRNDLQHPNEYIRGATL